MQLELALPISTKQEKRTLSWNLMTGRGFETDSGVPVSPILAENLSAAFASVQLIAQTIASLPLYVYRKDASGARYEDPQHPLARLLAGDPNEHQTVADFFELMQANVLWHGNAYAEIVRDTSGRPVELVPHHPGMISVERLPGARGRRLRYIVSDIDGGSRRLLQEEMLHIRDRSDDGLCGKSRLQRAREAFGQAIAAEKFAARIWGNSAAMSGFVSHPETLGPEAAETLRQSLADLYGGLKNAGRIGVLEEGMTWTALSVSPEDAQLLESRRFSVESVARMFGVPPQLIGDTSKTAFANMIEASRHFARFTLAPWCSKWEQALARSLFSEADRATHEIEVNLDELLRGDPLQRAQTWRVYRELGVVSANEIRDQEGWNPRTDPDGDVFFAPLNLQSEQAGKPRQEA